MDLPNMRSALTSEKQGRAKAQGQLNNLNHTELGRREKNNDVINDAKNAEGQLDAAHKAEQPALDAANQAMAQKRADDQTRAQVMALDEQRRRIEYLQQLGQQGHSQDDILEAGGTIEATADLQALKRQGFDEMDAQNQRR